MKTTVVTLNPAGSSAKSWTDPSTMETTVRHGRLLHKLLVVFLSLSLIPLVLTGLWLTSVGEHYIQKEIVGVKLGIAQKVASSVAGHLEDLRNTLQIVHKSSDFLTMNPIRQSEILSTVMNAYPMFMRMTVIDLDGRVISSVNRMGDPLTKEASQEEMEALRSIRSLGDYVGPVSRSPEGYPEMTLAVPVERVPGRPTAVLLGVINLIDLSSLVKDIVLDAHGYVYVVDMDHDQLVAHPDVQVLLRQDKPDEVRALDDVRRLHPEFFEGAQAETGALEMDTGSAKYLATYAKVPRLNLNWKVFVQQPVEEAYRASREMRKKIIIVLLPVFIATVLIGYALSRWLVNQVQTLQEAIEQVAEGNFDIRPVPISNDEFGSLAEKFVWMARSLKDKTLKLMSAQRELQQWNSDLEHRVQERTRDLKEAQEQLIAQEKLAALGQMASVVGHELRNPLAVMSNSVYFLKTKLTGAPGSDSLDPKVEKHLKIVEGEIGKSNTIIRDVLDFSRNRPLHAAPHKLDEQVEKAIERIQIPADITLNKRLTLGQTEVMVDEDEFRQVLVNLMENACQSMTKGGTLTVGTKSHPAPGAGIAELVEIRIGDTGCGIPQEHVNKIFAPFFTTKSRGTGLGLAVVKKIIDRHSGVIQVESVVGEGTTFSIKLPVKGVRTVVGGTDV
jgi:signal transduction histidine kinase